MAHDEMSAVLESKRTSAARILAAIPTTRRAFDFVKATPGVSQSSQSGGALNLVSVFGAGVTENSFYIDGTNFTATSNGIARIEPGLDFIEEVQVQSIGASVEYGNLQGAVINFITRQGSDRWQYDTSYFAQPGGLTSEPIRLGCGDCGEPDSGYHRSRYRDFTTSLGGPAIRDRLWFFAGYQYLRDNDSQPGTDPDSPRKYEQNKLSAKLTWQLAKGWQLIHSVQAERWVNPEQPTYTKKISSTQEQRASSPAMTLAHLTHSASANTVWDVRVGQLRFSQESSPTSGDRLAANRSDLETQITTGGPQQIGGVDQILYVRKGDRQPLPDWTAGQRSRVENWRVVGKRRAPIADGDSFG